LGLNIYAAGLPPDNRLRTPPVTPWAISLLKPAFIGCNTLALNPAVNAPNIPCFKFHPPFS
jgi:capsular polysaccharide biosynthesis protein